MLFLKTFVANESSNYQEKKAAENKRKEEGAAEDDAAAATSRAKMETDSIVEALEKRNLKMYDIAPDGDCLYNSIAHQMTEKSTNIVSSFHS